jgi:hypothetical protein
VPIIGDFISSVLEAISGAAGLVGVLSDTDGADCST